MVGNTRFLLGRWLVVGIVAAILAIVSSAYIAAGQAWIALFTIVLTVVIVLVIRWRVGDRRLRKLLQAESPDPLVAFCRRTIRPGRLPHGDALLAQSCAVAYLLYAEYASARAALTEVEWDGRPPLIRALRTSVEALLCYFETREYIQGYNLAVVAQELATTPALFPGAQTAAAAYESQVEIGQVLCGRSTDATVASLAQNMPVLPTLGRLLVAWGLAIAHYQRGEGERADVMLEYIRKVAPHCRALALPDDLGQRAAMGKQRKN